MKNQIEILELKNAITEINLTDGLGRRIEEREKESVNWEIE